MKDLKRKKEEERKLLIDKTDTKKEKAVKAPEPKKEEDWCIGRLIIEQL